MGDEVPRPRRPALGPLVHPVGDSPWSLGPLSFHKMFMGKLNPTSPRAVVHQAPEGDQSGGGCDSEVLVSGRGNVLLLHDLPDGFTYRSLHDLFKPFGTVVRIRLVYDKDCSSNRCYVHFATSEEAKSASEAVLSLELGVPSPRVELLSSRNVTESDHDYVPNIFEHSLSKSCTRTREGPCPRWFVGNYRDGKGNFILASRYLNKEIGQIPAENLKKFGKGVLIRAKDLTQAKMLLHFKCPEDSIFEAIKPHRTFNFSKGTIYNYDLYEFSEEDILSMCPKEVQKVTKMKGKGNMMVLTFYGSSSPDYVSIGPLDHLRVKSFVDRPFQCFRCFEFGHGKKTCTKPPRCGKCSALNSHNTEECDADPYCFHCRANHFLRSRECPRYCLEQDILQFANRNFISLGSARRELAFRQGKDGGAKSYATTLGSRPSSHSAPCNNTATRLPANNISRSPVPSTSGVPVVNWFSVLTDNEGTGSPAQHSSVMSPTDRAPAIRLSPSRNNKNPKRHHGSTDSVESSDVPPQKVCVASPNRVHAPETSLSSSVDGSVHSVHSPNKFHDVPSAGESTDIDAVRDISLVDEAGSTPKLVEGKTAAVPRLNSPSRESVSPVRKAAGPQLNSLTHAPLSSSVRSAEVPRPSFSQKTVSTFVKRAMSHRHGSLSQKTVPTSVRKAEAPRPGTSSQKSPKVLTIFKNPRLITLQSRVGTGTTSSGGRPKTNLK